MVAPVCPACGTAARLYCFLAERMGIDREACHTAQFTIEQCREASKALNGVCYPEIRDWAQWHRAPKKLADPLNIAETA